MRMIRPTREQLIHSFSVSSGTLLLMTGGILLGLLLKAYLGVDTSTLFWYMLCISLFVFVVHLFLCNFKPTQTKNRS